MRILVVDDDAVFSDFVALLLRKAGHEVMCASGGDEGLAAWRSLAIPVVITDWGMPGTNGLEVCRTIRREEPGFYTYLILLTGRDGRESYLQGLDSGADDFLNKAPDADEIKARLRVAERILGLKGRIRQLEGLLPICSYCKNIRDERGAWVKVEQYVTSRTAAQFSHGICPPCYATKVQPELDRHAARGEGGAPGTGGGAAG